jgi:hypothetical protein
MAEEVYTNQAELERVAARRFAEAWDLYWAVWSFESAGRFPELGECSVALTRFAFLAGEDCDEDANDVLLALALMMMLVDDLILASFSDDELTTLVRPSRRGLEQLVLRSGVADWCLRAGAPLQDEEGTIMSFGEGPLRGQSRDIGLALHLEYGAPGAGLAAWDARRDIASAIAHAAPLCRDVHSRLARGTDLPDDYRRRVEKTGVALIRTARIAGPAVAMDFAVRNASAELNVFAEGLFGMPWIGRCLKLIAVARSPQDIEGLPFEIEDIAELEDFASALVE